MPGRSFTSLTVFVPNFGKHFSQVEYVAIIKRVDRPPSLTDNKDRSTALII